MQLLTKPAPNWLLRSCPRCGGDVQKGVERNLGYDWKGHVAYTCLQCGWSGGTRPGNPGSSRLRRGRRLT